MTTETFALTAEDEGVRIDHYLVSALDGISRSQIQKWITNGNVTSSLKSKIKKNHVLTEGEVLTVDVPEPKKLDVLPENMPLDIIYEDDDVAVVLKQIGMVVHPAPGNYQGTLVNALLFNLVNLSDIGGVIRPGIVHRIDKDTSGLLMIAKTNLAHQSLAKQLKEHTVVREYIAVVRGGFSQNEGTIDKPIARSKNNRLKMTIDHNAGKRAITHYKVLERFGEQSVISCKLETGRTHQIRVHLASIAHPLVGDPLYGIKKDRQHGKGQLLHAKTIGFKHPRTGEELSFSSELPEHVKTYIDKLRKQHAVKS